MFLLKYFVSMLASINDPWTAFPHPMTTQTNGSICCNPLGRNGMWCYRCGTYMHMKCSGFKRGKDHTHDFVCKRSCSNDSHQSEPPVNEHPIPEPITDAHGPNSTLQAADFWMDKFFRVIEKVKLMYEEAAHWKSVSIIPKNKTGFKIVDSFNNIFSRTMDCLKLPWQRPSYCPI